MVALKDQNTQSLETQIHSIESMERGQSILEKSGHPTTLIFHFLFRTLAILVYLFGVVIYDNFIFIFILVILLLAFDFWTVKNVSGRLLVGLRWWNQVQEGKTKWIFESKDAHVKPNSVDSRLFWMSLYLYVFIWILLGLISLLSPRWLLIVFVALVLNISNLVGYTKCDKDAKRKLVSGLGDTMVGSFLSSNIGSML